MKTCFVISPIGKEGSDVRKEADDLFELIIKPSLDRFNFEVIRADTIPRPSVITSDIIQLVQNSDLCIIDLTGSNPNVFYECGRRHETGKPFIQLIKKGGELPFDVAGIRTIPYDFSSAREAHNAIKNIQLFVSELEKEGFKSKTSGESLTSIASSIERIERRLSLLSTGPLDSKSDETTMEALELITIKANPKKAFYTALEEKKWDKAHSILPVLKEVLGNTNDLLVSAGIFAGKGDEYSVAIMKEILESPSEELKPEAIKAAFLVLNEYYDIVDEELEGATFLEPIVKSLCKQDNLDEKIKGYICNAVQRLLYRATEFEHALEFSNLALKFDDADDSYHYNKGC